MTDPTLRPRGGLTIGPSPLPDGYLNVATGLANGLAPLQDAGPTCALVCTFVAGQVLETALKAFLLAKGRTEDQLKHVGHDLQALWAEAHNEGLPIGPTPTPLLGHAANMHKRPFPLRYASNDKVLLSFGGRYSDEVEPILAAVAKAIE